MPLLDYSLNDISRIVESSGSKILNSYVREVPSNKDVLEVFLKINSEDLSLIVREFKQQDFSIVYAKSSHYAQDNAQDNYLNLIRYLDQ